MNNSLQLAIVGAVFVLLLLAGAWIDKKWRTYKGAKASSKAAKLGLKAEKDAEKLLRKLGYVLLQRQPPASYWAVVDAEPQNIKLSGDLLVELKGKTYLAEVKTGKAVKLEHAETRRQLLEYQLAFGVDGILLVDMEAKVVRSVVFPAPKPAAKAVAAAAVKKKATRYVAMVAAAAAAAWLVSRSMSSSVGASHKGIPVVEHARVLDDGKGVAKARPRSKDDAVVEHKPIVDDGKDVPRAKARRNEAVVEHDLDDYDDDELPRGKALKGQAVTPKKSGH